MKLPLQQPSLGSSEQKSHLSEQQGFLMLGAKFPTNNLD
jgi:hypothetical protein